MKQFMINIDLPEYFDDKFLSKIPAQRKQISHLMNQNIIQSYSLSEEKDKVWIIVNAENEKDVKQALYTLPLIDWMSFHIHPLTLHQKAIKIQVPSFSLN